MCQIFAISFFQVSFLSSKAIPLLSERCFAKVNESLQLATLHTIEYFLGFCYYCVLPNLKCFLVAACTLGSLFQK